MSNTGARLHNFDLVNHCTLLKSLPPVVTLYLIDTWVTDRHYKRVNQKLRFNVSPARQWAKNQVVFNLNGYHDPIIYRYEEKKPGNTGLYRRVKNDISEI